MKMIKKIAAVGCALTMAVSMMSMGVNALEVSQITGDKYWNLHYTKGAPTSDNVIECTSVFVCNANGNAQGICTGYSINNANDSYMEANFYINGTVDHLGGMPIHTTGTFNKFNSGFVKGKKYSVISALYPIRNGNDNNITYFHTNGYYK